jgi:hypothetical protein
MIDELWLVLIIPVFMLIGVLLDQFATWLDMRRKGKP